MSKLAQTVAQATGPTVGLQVGDADMALQNEPEMKRSLRSPAIVFMVVAAAAPLTAATGVLPLSFLFSKNFAAPVYFVVATILLSLFAVGYIALSKYVTDAGAFYAYISAGLGRTPGNAAAMLALGAYSLTVVALTVYAGFFTSNLVATFTPWAESPWWLWSILWCGLLALVGYRNVEFNSRVLAVQLTMDMTILVVLGTVIFLSGGKEGFNPAALSPIEAFGHGVPASGIMWAVLCFVGFEATAVYRNEARDPERTIPRATYAAAMLIGVLYMFVSLSIVTGAGTNYVIDLVSADPAVVLFALGDQYIGSWYSTLLNVFLLNSIFAAALSFHNVVARYQHVMGVKGLLPSYVGRVHVRHLAPSNASLVLTIATFVTIIIAAILNLDPVLQVFGPLIGILGFAVLTMMASASLAAIVYFARLPQPRPGIFVRLVAPSVATLGLLWVLVKSLANIGVITGSRVGTLLVIALLITLPLLGVMLSFLQSHRASFGDDTTPVS